MKITTAIIAAAGFGSRFLPVVKNVPKEMLPIIDKPSIQYLVEDCIEAGLERVILVVRKGNNVMRDYFTNPAGNVKELLAQQGKSSRFESVEKVLAMKQVMIIEQNPDLPYGNGSPIYSAKKYLSPDEAYVLLFGDDMVLTPNGNKSVKQIIDFYHENEGDTDAVLAGVELEKEVAKKWGACVKFKSFDKASNSGIMEFQVEKPTEEEFVKNNLTPIMTYGRMVVDYNIFNYLTPTATGKDGELWLQDAIAKTALKGTVKVKILDGQFMTTGDPMKYIKSQIYYYLNNSEYGTETKEFLKSLVIN
jgi:UTP--glucose-1-phosphate uridylyltransferase